MPNETLKIFETELAELSQKTTPFAWASTKNNLGHAFVALSLDQSNYDGLKQSVKEIEDKLEDCNMKDSREEWLALQTELSATLHTLGQREPVNKVSNFNSAMEAYKALLPAITRQESPLEWATMLHNIAGVFQGLGEHSDGARSLERSISAYNNALMVRTPDDHPMEWALTQNNAAVSMQLLGMIKQDGDILNEAIKSYANAQQKLKQADMPLAWFITTSNLGTAQLILAEETKDIDIARQAVNNFNDIVEFLHDASNSQHLEFATQFQEKALAVLAQLGG